MCHSFLLSLSGVLRVNVSRKCCSAEDIAFAESRIRAETVAAEDVLHDQGAISMISSDSQAMGRVGEVVSRTWRTASKMRGFKGPLKEDTEETDNFRVKRYIAKYTINPCGNLSPPFVQQILILTARTLRSAIAHGVSHIIGDISVGKLADLVMWQPSNFGIRAEQVIKGGVIAWAQVSRLRPSSELVILLTIGLLD